ncbi:MAG: hypothetical protein Q8M06_00410 [Methanobacteriaceae archaeon]|nr:hypothetical protein [Methanobacteriaceae archaeon]MDZ4172562.1 hypothetical protein [Methanobacteriaceae archaeon]
MAPTGMVSGRLDDYYFKLYESSGKTGRELIEFALDILSKKDPALVNIRLDEIKKQRNSLDLEEKQLKEGINIGIDIPDKAETPLFDIIEAVERYCEYNSNENEIVTPHDVKDQIIVDIIAARKSNINIREIRDYFNEKYPIEINDIEINDIEIDYVVELRSAVKQVKINFENNKKIYSRQKGWHSIDEVDLDFIKIKTKNFNVDPLDVAKELGISV